MNDRYYDCPIKRLFSKIDRERMDDLGFLDPVTTPQVVGFSQILDQHISWIVAPPWLGKSTVANTALNWLRITPSACGGIEDRSYLSPTGSAKHQYIIPPWWNAWRTDELARPAIWFLDGIDESDPEVRTQIDNAVRILSDEHRSALRLILLSRPHVELQEFRDQLASHYGGDHRPAVYWLTRFHRDAAETLIGKESFAIVCKLIERNSLQSVAGIPVVLNYLRKYPETQQLTVPDVWEGILKSLLGEPESNRLSPRDSSLLNRYEATCQIASLLALTRQSVIRKHSPDRDIVTIDNLFQIPDNVLSNAARAALSTAAFVELPETGAYRFKERNVQDWFAAFGMEQLSAPSIRTTFAGADGKLAEHLRETARLITTITKRMEVREELHKLAGIPLLPSDASPELGRTISQIDLLESLAADSPWGLRFNYSDHDELSRLNCHGLGDLLALRLQDPERTPQVKLFLLEIAEATKSIDAVDAAAVLIKSDNQSDRVRLRAASFVSQYGGIQAQRDLGDYVIQTLSIDQSDVGRRLCGVLVFWLLQSSFWPVWKAALYAPRAERSVIDSRDKLMRVLGDSITIADAWKLLPNLRDLYDRHSQADERAELPKFLRRVIDLAAANADENLDATNNLVDFAVDLIDEKPDDGLCYMTVMDIQNKLIGSANARRRFFCEGRRADDC